MTRTLPAFVLLLALAAAPASADDGISKVNGSITAESGRSHGDLETVNGSIRFEDASRAGDAQTVNGSIRAGNDIESGSLGTVNGSIRVGTGAKIGGGIETVNGSVFVDRGGTIAGDVETVNGAIGLVDVDLAGGIETVNGDVTAGVGSHVKGGIRVHKPTSNWLPFVTSSKRKPRIIVGPGAVVEGPLVFEREVTLYVHDSARTGTITGATPVRYSSARAPVD